MLGSNATSSAAGNIATTVNWTYNPSSPTDPTTKDTLFIDHVMFWNTNLNWASSSIDVVIVRNGGAIGPVGNNEVLTLPAGTDLIVETGGTLNNMSGNNSNHAIRIGTICVWGKACCSSSATIHGPVGLNAANPCGFVVLPEVVLSFQGKRTAREINLFWTMGNAGVLLEFKVFRSVNGGALEEVKVLKYNSAMADYSFNDEVEEDKSYTYTLEAHYNNGEIKTLKTITFSSQPKLGLTINGRKLDINTNALELEPEVKVYDLFGKLVLTKIFGDNPSVDISELIEGQIYVIQIIIEGVPFETQKIFL